MSSAAIALIYVGGFFAAVNWMCLISSIVTKKNHSMVPPLGGLLLSVGFALHPVLRPFTICGLLLDIGFWALLFSIPTILGEALQSAPWRRVARISGQWNEITFHLSLYRPDYYAVKVSRELPLGQTGCIGWGSFGRWSTVGTGLQFVSHMDTDELPSRVILSGGLESMDLPVAESTYSAGDEAPEFPPVGVVFHSR